MASARRDRIWRCGIDASTQLVDFVRDNVDAAIRYGAGRYAGLVSELLMDVEVSPVCSPRLLKGEHPLATPGDLRWHRLLHTDWSSQRGEEPDWRMWLLAAGVRDIDWTKGPQFNDWMLAMQAAIEGQGVVLGRSALVANDLAGGRLVRPFNVSVPGKVRLLPGLPGNGGEARQGSGVPRLADRRGGRAPVT